MIGKIVSNEWKKVSDVWNWFFGSRYIQLFKLKSIFVHAILGEGDFRCLKLSFGIKECILVQTLLAPQQPHPHFDF